MTLNLSKIDFLENKIHKCGGGGLPNFINPFLKCSKGWVWQKKRAKATQDNGNKAQKLLLCFGMNGHFWGK